MRIKFSQQGFSFWAILIVMAFMVAAIIISLWPQDYQFEGQINNPTNVWLNARRQALEINEKAKIEKWIVDNKLNEYGDSADTLYAGGTPLFDETTGKTMSRWEYIKKKHPDKPWNK